MTQQENTLRAALNKVDRERRRATVMLCVLLGMTCFFWIAMMFSKDDHAGLPLGLAAVMGTVYVAGFIAAKASHDNTRAILKAIELLAEQNQGSTTSGQT
jgi:hypothetical protein